MADSKPGFIGRMIGSALHTVLFAEQLLGWRRDARAKALSPADFRKGMDGLAALVKEQLKADPFSGVVYVFRANRSDRSS